MSEITQQGVTAEQRLNPGDRVSWHHPPFIEGTVLKHNGSLVKVQWDNGEVCRHELGKLFLFQNRAAPAAPLPASAPNALDVLRGLEWCVEIYSAVTGLCLSRECPSCRRDKEKGHKPTCPLAAALQSDSLSPAPGEWKLISTAPKDGTPVLIAQENKYGWYVDVAENFYDVDDRLDAPDVWGAREGGMTVCLAPTHWRPLPDPPASSASKD